MAIPHSSPSSALPTPHGSPVIRAQPFPEGSAASEQPRWPRKRRLTAPPDLQLGAAQQVNKKARLVQGSEPEVHIVDDVDELIPKLHAMGKDASLFTPQSGAFDASFVPLVFDDGVLSFYTPSHDSSDTGRSTSPPSSAASSASFLGVLPDHPRYSRPDIDTLFQGLSLWQGGDEEAVHVYAQTINGFPQRPRETVSIEDLDPSLMRYGPVHTAISQLPCQFMHVDIPIAGPSSATIDVPYPISSIITISTPFKSPVRLMTALYTQGTLVSSHEAQMEGKALPLSECTLYSAPLPQELVQKLCKGVSQSDETKTALDGSKKDVLDITAVMQFVQQDEQGVSVGAPGEEIVLAVVCDFYTHKGPLPSEVKVSHLLPRNEVSQELFSPTGFFPTPPPSREHLVNLKDGALSSHVSHCHRAANRAPPKLSVAIPPPSTHGGKGRIQLYSDSPGLTPDSAIRRLTPQTGVPQNVLPMTPFEQLMHTPLYPPEMPRSTRARAGYAPTPTESAYPFTLSSTSPGTAQSPAFGILDSTPGTSGSAPAWLTFPRNSTPLTPSFFLQHPHTATASNAMSSMTQRALDAGTPTLFRTGRSEYFDQPLASPLPIASAPLFPIVHANPDISGPPTAPGWSPSTRHPQSS